MKNILLLVLGTLFLISMLALSSFVSAAPPQVPPTPVSDEDSSGIDPASIDTTAPVAPAATNPGTMVSRILVFNPDTAMATVSIKIYDKNGILAATLPNFTVAVNGAVAKNLPASIATGFSGSAQVSSDRNVQAFVTNANSSQGARDEYAGTLSPATTLTLPMVRHYAANTRNSIIAVQNTSATTTTITLTLYDANGNPMTDLPGTTATNVAPLASAYFNTNTIFPTGQFAGSARITADGTVVLAASEQNRWQKDTVSFRALTPDDQGTTLYVNFAERVVNTTGVVTNWNELYVRNEGTLSTTVKAEYFGNKGALRYTTQSLAPVPANGTATFSTKGATFASLGTAFKGWVKLTSVDGQPISAYAIESWSGVRLFGTEAVPTAQAATLAACGDVFRNTSQTSTINVLNTGVTTATLAIKLYNPSTGASFGNKQVSVGPNMTVSVAATDVAFSSAGTTYDGLALIKLTNPQLFVKPPLVVSVYTPYIYSGVAGGVTSYTCSKLQP